MMIESAEASEAELRAVPRTGLFLAALLEYPGNRLPVRIRNLSATGAQLELTGLPTTVHDVSLLRAHLAVPANVAWRSDGRAGLRFENVIALDEWVPSHSGEQQMKIDRRIATIRKNLAGPGQIPGRPHHLQLRVAEELGIAARQISHALDEFASFAPLLSRCPKPLQELEIVWQTLGHLEKLLCADDPSVILDSLGMDELKRRLLR